MRKWIHHKQLGVITKHLGWESSSKMHWINQPTACLHDVQDQDWWRLGRSLKMKIILITANHTWWMWRSYIYILYLIYVIYILLLCHSLSFYTYNAWSSSVILYNHHCESYILGSWLKPMRMTRTHGIFWAMGHQNFEVCIYLWELVEWNSARTAVCWVWRLANTWFHACNIVTIALKTY